jgi:parallel beta-helix repeat protein
MSNAVRFCVVVAMSLLLGACGGGGGGGAFVPACSGSTCYVRTNGSDTNTGADPDHALKTISKAAQIAGDGYTIIVGAGTYREGVTTRTSGAAPQGLRFIADVSGTQTQDAGAVIIVVPAGNLVAAGFKLSGAAAGLIDGFEIRGAADGGIVLKSHSDDFTVQNCVIHDNSGDGIRVQDSASVLVFNNLVYKNGGAGVGIVGTVAGSPNARVYSNTIADNTDHGITVGTTSASSPNALIRNNIVQHNDNFVPQENIKVITNPRSDVGYDEDFDLVFPPSFFPAGQTHEVVSDAQFVGESVDEFHLLITSPAINAGDALNLPDDQLRNFRARTTTGSGADNGVLDLGFHFPR